MLKRFILAILLVFSGGVAQAQSVPSCTLTGTVQDASGAPLANGVINFDSIKTQVIAGQAVARIVRSINTNPQGVIGPNTFAQMLAVSITICDQMGNCGAPFSAIIPNQASSPFGNMIMGSYLTQPLPNPAASGQVFGVNSNNTAEWETVSGGRGNCSFVWNSANSYTLNCPGFATLASPTFTGTAAVASGSNLALLGNGATQLFFGSATTPSGSLTSLTGPNMSVAAGAHYNGTAWVADATAATLETWTNSGIFFYENTGLTVGNTFTPATMGTLSTSGLSLPGSLSLGASSILTANTINAGSLTLTTPLTPANGGTGTSTVPTSPQILIAQSATASYAPETVSGDMTLSATGVATVTKTNGIAFGAAPSAGQMLIAQSATAYAPETIGGDLTMAPSGAGTVVGLHFGTTAVLLATSPAPTNGGIAYFSGSTTLVSSAMLTANNPVLGGGISSPPSSGTRSGSTTIFATTTGTLTNGHCVNIDASGNFTDAGGACAVSGGPTFPAGSPPMIAGYSATNVSEAETVSGGPGACTFSRTGLNAYQLSCPSYATLASPTFTGTITMPDSSTFTSAGHNNAKLVSPTMSGTVTMPDASTFTATGFNNAKLLGTVNFPDGSTYTTAGHNNMKALGIGAPAPTVAGNLLQATYSGNAGAVFNLTNATAGTNAATLIYLNGDLHNSWMMQTSSTFTAAGPNVPGDALDIGANGANGMVLNTNATISPGPPIVFWSGSSQVATMAQVSNAGALVLPNSTTSSIYWGSATQPNATLASLSANSLNMQAGSHNNGSSWIADATSNEGFNLGGGGFSYYIGLNQTIGTPATSVLVASLNSGAFGIAAGMTYQVGGAQIKTTNLADRTGEIGWTPQLQFGGATTGITYQGGFPYGYYWRMGPLVHVIWGIWLGSKGTATGSATLCNLPFNVSNDGSNSGFYPLINYGTLSIGSSGYLPGIFFGGNGNKCVAIGAANTGTAQAGSVGGLSNANFLGTDNIQGSFTYATNDP